MAPSVKVRDADKRRLDRLQRKIQARRGRSVAQEDVLSWIITLGERNIGLLAEDANRPMTDREIAALMRLPVRTGIRTSESEIDDVLARDAR